MKVSQKLQNNPYYIIEILALLFGALVPFSFSPYGLFWLQFPLIAFLFLICLEQTPRRTFLRAFLFGLGWFVHGIHWLFYSLYFHGGSPVFLAVLMVVILAAVLALFPAFAMSLANRFIKARKIIMLLVVYPLVIMLFEWLRGYVLTGLPWVQLGTAHVDTYLAGFAPLIGGLGMVLMAGLVSGVTAMLVMKRLIENSDTNNTFLKTGSVIVLVIYMTGFLLGFIEWTRPAGEPVKVSLIQGNVAQSEKWKRENYRPTLEMYRQLTQLNYQSDLIIWPETAIPGFKSRVSHYLNELKLEAENTQTELLMGVFIRDPQTKRYYNSVITLDDQVYKKRHLVPLGEYFPFRFLLDFFAQWINIPLSDIDLGDKNQPLIEAAGQKIGVNICFEDVFDRDVLLDLPEATLLVNVSNDAWFEDSPEPWQHHQIARVRALETGRVLLRATNTGVTSVIGRKGEVQASLPQFKRDVLNVTVQGYEGATPYVLWANYLLIILSLLVLGFIYMKGRSVKKRAQPTQA